jgi:DNA-binding NarL/FixJ family response regulator
MEQIKLLITDDHTLVRESWVMMFEADPRFKVIAACSTGEEAVEMTRAKRPDVVIMDINLPGISGITATEEICKEADGSKVLIVSMHAKAGYVRKLMQSGALGYVTKNSGGDEMKKAAVEVHNNRKYICEEIKDILTQEAISGGKPTNDYRALSEKELNIISYLKQGFSSREIASSIGVTVKTVEVHRYNILRKLNLPNVAALINYVNQSQLAGDI